MAVVATQEEEGYGKVLHRSMVVEQTELAVELVALAVVELAAEAVEVETVVVEEKIETNYYSIDLKPHSLQC